MIETCKDGAITCMRDLICLLVTPACVVLLRRKLYLVPSYTVYCPLVAKKNNIQRLNVAHNDGILHFQE